MTHWPAFLFSFCIGALLTAGAPLVGQQPPANTNVSAAAQEKEQIESALKLTREAAGKYEIVPEGISDVPARLRAEPVLRWSNPAVGEIHGNVFLWTLKDSTRIDGKAINEAAVNRAAVNRAAVNERRADRTATDGMGAGRPVAIGSLFKWFSPHTHTSHEFHSLAEVPITASYEGSRVWVTKQPGVKFLPLEGAAVPAATPARRLAQMRDLAKRFTGHMTTRENDERQLRLLPQPIYRYASADRQGSSADDAADGNLAASGNPVTGGLFAFVESTDPEILLLLEARGEKSPRWYFAGARMQNVTLVLKFDDREVWSVPTLEWSEAFDHTQPYTLFDTPGK